MFNTHDPLEEIHRAGRAQEDDHFRKRDQELLMALRAQGAAESEQAIRHYAHMRCPKCGEPLQATPARRVTMDACPGCGGIWLDKGAWEGLVGPPASGWLQRPFAGPMASNHAQVLRRNGEREDARFSRSLFMGCENAADL
jgi:Zn-finger nucleic acid-binding protein